MTAAFHGPSAHRDRRATAVEVRRNVPYALSSTDAPLRLDVYGPADEGGAPRPVILAIHGGGWRRFSKEEYGRAVSIFAKRGYVVVAPNYKLSSRGRPTWPAPLENLEAAVAWVRAHAVEIDADPSRIVAMGESAGGHLAALLGVDPKARIQAVVDFYGPTDLFRLDRDSPLGGLASRQMLGGSPASLPDQATAASPALRVDRESAPMLIVQGLVDTLVPPSQSRELAEALGRQGVDHELIEVPGVGHGFRLRVGRTDFVPTILAFLERRWNDEA